MIQTNFHHKKHYKIQAYSKKILYITLILTISFALLEYIGGLLSNSLALLGDSFHMFSDVIALGFSLIALLFSSKKPNKKYTFGFVRLEVLAAFLNGLMLVGISIYLIFEGFMRFFNPKDIDFKSMLIISTIGLIFNIVVTIILTKSLREEDNLNIQSALWHFLGDLISSIGIIISSTIIYFTNYQIVDVIMSIIISIILFKGGYKITKSSFVILMEATTLDTKEIYNKIKEIDGIDDIHEFHIWHTDTNETNAAMHILLKEYNTSNDYKIVENVKIFLKEEYDIEHCFIALENIKYNDHTLH